VSHGSNFIITQVTAGTGVAAIVATAAHLLDPILATVATFSAVGFYTFNIWESRTIKSRMRLRRRRWNMQRQLQARATAAALLVRQQAAAAAAALEHGGPVPSLVTGLSPELDKRLTIIHDLVNSTSEQLKAEIAKVSYAEGQKDASQGKNRDGS
jgi:hypothetical protein